MSPEEQPVPLEKREIPLVWVGSEDLQVVWANQFLIQIAEGEVFLSAGQSVPPPLMGTEEQKIKQLDALDFVPVQTLVRLGIPPTKLRQLHELLDGAVKALDKQNT